MKSKLPLFASLARLKGWAKLTENAGDLTMEDKTSTLANAFSKSLSLLSGAGSITGSSGFYHFAVNRANYEAGVVNGIGAYNAEVVKVIAAARK